MTTLCGHAALSNVPAVTLAKPSDYFRTRFLSDDTLRSAKRAGWEKINVFKRKLAITLVGIIPNQILPFFSDKDRRTDSWIRRRCFDGSNHGGAALCCFVIQLSVLLSLSEKKREFDHQPSKLFLLAKLKRVVLNCACILLERRGIKKFLFH